MNTKKDTHEDGCLEGKHTRKPGCELWAPHSLSANKRSMTDTKKDCCGECNKTGLACIQPNLCPCHAESTQKHCTCASFFTVRGEHKKDCPLFGQCGLCSGCHKSKGCHDPLKEWKLNKIPVYQQGGSSVEILPKKSSNLAHGINEGLNNMFCGDEQETARESKKNEFWDLLSEWSMQPRIEQSEEEEERKSTALAERIEAFIAQEREAEYVRGLKEGERRIIALIESKKRRRLPDTTEFAGKNKETKVYNVALDSLLKELKR